MAVVIIEGISRRRILLTRTAAERRARGIIVGSNGRQLGGNDKEVKVDENSRRLGGEIIEEISPRQLAAMAAEQRAGDQKRCGAKQAEADMRRETERAQREGTTTQAKDIGNVIDLNDLKNYDLEDIFGMSATSSSNRLPTPQSTVNDTFQSDWNCRSCTFQNPPLYLSCMVCQAEREATTAETENSIEDDFGVSWECRLCTFKNENTDGMCIICGLEI